MNRFCVACRARKPASELTRWYLGEDSTLLLGKGKRSVWVCPAKKCIEKLEKKPTIARRSLQHKNIVANSCMQQVQDWNKYIISKYLSLSQQSGVVFSGQSQILKNKEVLSFLVLCSTSKTSTYTAEPFIHFPTTIQTFHIDVDPRTLGFWIGKGARSAVGLSQNRHSIQLLKYLHQYQNLR